MAHVEAKIVSGLMAHFSGLSLPAGVGVAYPNVNFTPSGSPYVRLSLAKNTPTNPHISGALTIYRGIFMAVVCWPINQGIVAASELAGAIRDHFAFNDALNNRRVISHDGIEISIGLEDAPRVAGDDQGTVYTEIPVIIPWTVYP